MNVIQSIAQNTFRESIRDRILYIIVAFGVLMIASSLMLGSISLDQDIKIMKDFGLAGIFFFGILVSIFVGANLVYKEIDKRSIYVILSKPVKKYQFILGKFLGLSATLLVTTVFMSLIFLGILYWKEGVLSSLLLEAILLEYLELILLVALIITFSSFTSPIAAALYTVMLVIIGHSTSVLWKIATQTQNLFAEWSLKIVYYVFPNLEKFNIKNQVIYNQALPGMELVWTILYALVFITLLLSLATFILKKQEF